MTSTSKPLECRECPFFDRRRVLPVGPRNAPVMFVGDYPTLTTPERGQPFSDRRGVVLKTALHRLQNNYRISKDGVQRWSKLQQYKTLAVQCVSDDKPGKTAMRRCQTHLQRSLVAVQPRVIVIFGATAFSAFRVGRVKFSDVRGTFQDYVLPSSGGNKSYKLFVTFSLDAIVAKPGLFDDLLRDLTAAFLYAEGRKKVTVDESELVKNYTIPRTVEEVEGICQYIIDYHQEGQAPEMHLIGSDTETSALEMYDPDAKIIASSFAWEPGYATAILMDHPKAWWTPEEAVRVRTAVQRVWECLKPKSLHHEKFDRQAVEGRYGWTLENVVWDTMAGEHLLEEDKRGQYGLKVLTRTRLPQYAGYDGKVDEIRQAHGGKSRAEEAKRYVKALRKHTEEKKPVYDRAMRVYEKAIVVYEKQLGEWNERRLAEKETAKKEKRRMDRTKYGKKPPKPRKPKEPVLPENRPPFDFTLIPLDDMLKYAAIDADVCRQHVLHQNQRFKEEYLKDRAAYQKLGFPTPLFTKRLMAEHVIPTSKTLARMEFTGFPVDLPYLETLDAKLRESADKTRDRLYELAGEFVINNPAEVIAVLFHRGFIDPRTGKKVVVPINDDLRRTKKGQIKADEKALLYVHKQFGYEFPRILLEHRKANKARDPFLTNVREHAKLLDGRMHPSFHITGTATGRLSSSSENMQNFPKKLGDFNIKNIFVPPPGMTLINTDAKGAEIRLFTAYSGDAQLIEAIQNGLDTHSFFTSKVWPDATYDQIEGARAKIDYWYEIKKQAAKLKGQFVPPFSKALYKEYEALVYRRTKCKRVVFGTLYGAMAAKIAETAGIPLDEAQEVINLMFEMFPSIPSYIQTTQNEVAHLGGVYTKTGRKRRFPLAKVRMFKNRCFRQAVNFKIQSTSSDMVLWVLNQVAPVIQQDLRGELHATVHDSIVFSVPDAYVSQISDMMYKYGTEAVAKKFPWMPVPFLWDVEAGSAYGEVAALTTTEGDHDNKEKEDGDIVEGHDIREEINEEINEEVFA